MSNALLAQKIFEAVQALPDSQAQQTLDFIHFLNARKEIAEHRDLQQAQQPVMDSLWNNEIDEAWNHV